MPTINTGTAGVHNTLAAQFERDVEDKFSDLIGEEGKLTKLLSMTKDEDVISTVAEWGVTEHVPNYTTLSATPSSATTNLTWSVTEPKVFGVGDICMHESGETLRVQSVDYNATVDNITFEARSRGATAAASVASGDGVYNLGSAKDDGDDLGTQRITQDVMYENPVQLYWERVEFNGTEIAVNARKGIFGGDYVARKRGQVMRMMLEQMDFNAIFGEAAETAGVGSDTVRTLGGFRAHIATANKSTIATLSQSALENYVADRPNLRMGPNGDDLVVLCSDRGAVGLNSYSTQRIQAQPGGKTLGFALYEYVTPIGKITVMPHYQLSKTSDFNGLFFFLNRSEMTKAVLRPLKFYGDVDTGLVDVRTDAYLGQHSFKWGHPNHMGEINGVTAYA